MTNQFFERPILNSAYEYPSRHWELDANGQPTNRIIDNRRRAEFITPIPKPKKRKEAKAQQEIVFDEGKGLSTAKQQYDTMSMVNQVRRHVDLWRQIPNHNQWDVTPEKATMDTYWVPGVNNLGSYGRWAFAEFCDVYEMQADFEAKVEEHFNRMIDNLLAVKV